MSSWRAREHKSRERWNAKCSKCGELCEVPFDPKTPGRVVMCRNCLNIYT